MGKITDIKKVLITGIAGSGASYLAEYIIENYPEIEVHGISRWHSTTHIKNLENIDKKITIHEADLLDLSSIISALKKVKPDVIFHLAALANVRTSFITPSIFLNNNIIGTSNLLEAIRLLSIDPIIQICSSSEVYGQVDAKYVPIKENTPFNPASPYAVSKVAQDLLGYCYYTSYKMRIIRTRMFTYLNPRRIDLFATSFARQVALIEMGLQTELLHGNLDSVRTIIDVRDASNAYWEAILHCRYGEAYNIGGTTTMKVSEFLNILISLSDKPIPTRLDKNLLRPADVTLQIPSIEKFVNETGWKPRYSFEESAAYLLLYWRNEIAKGLSAKKDKII